MFPSHHFKRPIHVSKKIPGRASYSPRGETDKRPTHV